MRLVNFVKTNPIATSLLLVAMASGFFLLFPGVDIALSDLFYSQRRGFWLKRNDFLGLFRRSNDILNTIVVVVLLGSLAVKLARPDKPSPIRPSVVVYLISTALLGPVLIVNVILKAYWGRPRPVQIEMFGGDAPYVEVWRITDWCEQNCSFVAGEGAAAMWLVIVAMALPRPYRAPATLLTLVYVFLVSFNRIAFGGHFLSDVIIAFALTVLSAAVMHRIVIEQPPKWLTNEALEAGLTEFGRSLRGRRAGAGAR